MKFDVFGSQSYKKKLQFSRIFFSLLQKKEEEEEEGVRPTAQSVFKVRLIKFDETKKVPVIKQVKDVVENINLVQVRIHFHISILMTFF